MASLHIEVTGHETRFSAEYRKFIGQLMQLRDAAVNLQAVMDKARQTTTGGTDYQGLAGLLGLTTADPVADAQTIFNLHDGMRQKLQTTAVDDFVNRLG